MFEDDTGEVLYQFPHVAGFPLESMHVIDGGVFQDIHDAYGDILVKVWADPADPDKGRIDLIATEIEDRINFLNQYTLTEQARKLRYVHTSYVYIYWTEEYSQYTL